MILSQCHNYWSLMSFTACGVDLTALLSSGICIRERDKLFPFAKKPQTQTLYNGTWDLEQ